MFPFFKVLFSSCFSDQGLLWLCIPCKIKSRLAPWHSQDFKYIPGLYQTLHSEFSSLAIYALFLTILHIYSCDLFCSLIQDVFALSLYPCKAYLSNPFRFTSTRVPPLSLQPTAISPTTNHLGYWPMDHLLRMLSHNVITRLAQVMHPHTTYCFRCICAISPISTTTLLTHVSYLDGML